MAKPGTKHFGQPNKYMLSSTLGSYNVPKHIKGSVKSGRATSCLKCLKLVWSVQCYHYVFPAEWDLSDCQQYGNTGQSKRIPEIFQL